MAVTLAQGRTVLTGVELRDGWGEVEAPARQQLELHLLPSSDSGLAPRNARFRLQPGDRLWLGRLHLVRLGSDR